MKHVTTNGGNRPLDAVVGAKKMCSSHSAAEDRPQFIFSFPVKGVCLSSLSHCERSRFTTPVCSVALATVCLATVPPDTFQSTSWFVCLPYLCFQLQVSHTFTDYGPGLSYVSFEHGGQDTKFWDGWFGVRVTGSSVTVEVWEKKRKEKKWRIRTKGKCLLTPRSGRLGGFRGPALLSLLTQH